MTTYRNTTTDQSRVVAIKRYTTPNEAYLDAELLENNGISCSIDGAIGGTVLPFIQGQVSLTVAEPDAVRAVELVPGSELPDEND
ncbi:MAG: hypothetical protein K2K83_04575 [Rikenella sp.]|nr:hypothetical protein [Rikenella sp.]MDE6499961.1 hypothetical protein [Rikenella sp.]